MNTKHFTIESLKKISPSWAKLTFHWDQFITVYQRVQNGHTTTGLVHGLFNHSDRLVSGFLAQFLLQFRFGLGEYQKDGSHLTGDCVQVLFIQAENIVEFPRAFYTQLFQVLKVHRMFSANRGGLTLFNTSGFASSGNQRIMNEKTSQLKWGLHVWEAGFIVNWRWTVDQSETNEFKQLNKLDREHVNEIQTRSLLSRVCLYVLMYWWASQWLSLLLLMR